MQDPLSSAVQFKKSVMRSLRESAGEGPFFPEGAPRSPDDSAVLCLLSRDRNSPFSLPCLVFNKRSSKVKQAGDLCFPGGRISPRLDAFLSHLLRLPFFPLARWGDWSLWRRKGLNEAGCLSLLLATSLRESLEEMRLNPLGVSFLGPLPPQNLRIFGRVIYPMVGWINRQKHFLLNWEVESVLYVPLRDLLQPENYRCYRVTYEVSPDHRNYGKTQDFLSYLHQGSAEKEVLWGVTFRIAMELLRTIFGFAPPALETLPVIHRRLDRDYVNGGRQYNRKEG